MNWKNETDTNVEHKCHSLIEKMHKQTSAVLKIRAMRMSIEWNINHK